MEETSICTQLDNLKLLGRTFVDEKNKILYFNWTCSGIEFVFTGTYLAIDFVADYRNIIETNTKDKNWPWIGIVVDDNIADYQKVELAGKEIRRVLLECDQREKHKIKVIKLTENHRSFVGIKSFLTDGKIEKSENSKKKSIEFIGDSITCGFGNSTTIKEHPYYAGEENGYFAYAAIAAEAMKMDFQIIALSGICVSKNRELQNPYGMDELYCYTDRPFADRNLWMPLQKWDFHNHPVDYVVLNLGTNDEIGISAAKNPEEELENFCKMYQNFIKIIRNKNGKDTQIICALGSMDLTLFPMIEKIVEEYKKNNMDNCISCFCYSMMNPEDGLGACEHPTIITHKKMAEELVTYISGLNLNHG